MSGWCCGSCRVPFTGTRNSRRPRRGYCPRCYERWRIHGFPECGPPPLFAAVAGRRADYAELRSWRLTVAEAAARLGVSERTAWRYEAELRDAQSAGWPARSAAA